MTRFQIITYHGEGSSLFYVVDTAADEGDQPAVLASFRTIGEAREDATWRNEATAVALESFNNRIIDGRLRDAFGPEYIALGSERASLIRDDFVAAAVRAMEYKRRIGSGNLRSYADCLEAGKRIELDGKSACDLEEE